MYYCRLIIWLGIGLLWGTSPVVLAVEPMPPEVAPNPPRVFPAQQQQPLTLTELVSRVVQYHPALNVAELERQITSAKRLEKQGAFDPAINAQGSFARFNSSSAVGEVQNAFESQYTLDFLTRYGLEFSGGGKVAGGDIKTPVSPTGDGGEYFIRLKLPLLRNAWINEKSAAEKRAILQESVALAFFRQKRLDLLFKAIKSYWQWVGSLQKQTVEEDLLGIAQFRADAVGQRANAGDMAQIQVVEARQEVQRRQGRLIQAQRRFQQSSFDLSLFLWDAAGEQLPVPDAAAVPGDIPEPLSTTEDLIAEGKLKALKLRPELDALSISKDITRVDLRLAKNQLLPRLDAFINQGVEVGAEGIGPVVKTGVQLNVPLRYRTAKGQIRQSELNLRKLNVQERQLIRQIFTEVRDSVSALEAARQRYEAAIQEVDLARQLAEGERTRFEYGDSTLFLVNQRERSAAQTRLKLIDVLVDYQQALARYYAVTGQL